MSNLVCVGKLVYYLTMQPIDAVAYELFNLVELIIWCRSQFLRSLSNFLLSIVFYVQPIRH